MSKRYALRILSNTTNSMKSEALAPKLRVREYARVVTGDFRSYVQTERQLMSMEATEINGVAAGKLLNQVL